MFKLIIFCASLAVISCAHIDSREQVEQVEEFARQQNDQIREHREREQEQLQLQQQQLDDQRREQEQRIRDDDQERRDRINENRYDNFYRNQNVQRVQQNVIPAFITFQPAYVHIPNRNFYDDSNYKFQYTVSDRSTGDVKSHQETRRGDHVQGEYRLMDSDGYQRIVNYRASDRNGFDADVRREPAFTTLNQQFQQQQNYADNFNQNRQLYTVYQAQNPSFYTNQQFARNDDGRNNQQISSVTTTNNF